jgi:hypothetical protein
VLVFASGSWNEAQSCKSPFVCCDTGLDAEVGCFCKINTADSSRPHDGNDVHVSADPSHRGRLCFNDGTGIWRCIKGFCAPERYCLDEGKMCQNTDTGPICGPSETAEQILAAGCTDSCQCGCRGRGSTRFCPCSEQLAGRSIEVSADNTGNSATEIEATSSIKGTYVPMSNLELQLTVSPDDTLSLGQSCNAEGAKQCGSDWVAVICKNRQWITWKTCQKRQKCTQKPGQDPYCSPRKLPDI